jgi:hypothetical protein
LDPNNYDDSSSKTQSSETSERVNSRSLFQNFHINSDEEEVSTIVPTQLSNATEIDYNTTQTTPNDNAEEYDTQEHTTPQQEQEQPIQTQDGQDSFEIMQPIRSPDGQNSFELMLSYGYYPAVIVISDEDDKLFTHTSETYSEEKLKELNLLHDDTCVLCLEDMQSTLDGDAIVHASITQCRNPQQPICSHKYHANCFLDLCQNIYIRQDVTITFPHVLMPAIKCVLCRRFEEWRIVETGVIMPDRVRVYGFHKYQDTWSPTNKIICQNWITCPVLYSALQENLSVRMVGNDPLPVEYSMEGRHITPARLKEVAEDYLEHALPKRACSICRKKKKNAQVVWSSTICFAGSLCNEMHLQIM